MAGFWGHILTSLAEYTTKIKKLAMFENISLCLLKQFVEFGTLCVRYAFTTWGNACYHGTVIPIHPELQKIVINLQCYCTIYHSTMSDCKISSSKLGSPLIEGIIQKQNKNPEVFALRSSYSMYKTGD